VPALSKIFKTLPPDFPGAILVVMHLPNTASASRVAERLVGSEALP
jgi:chemotaxis response regulator CheB